MANDFIDPLDEQSNTFIDPLESTNEQPQTVVKPTAKGDLLESAKRAGGDIVQAADMILGIPAFVAKVGTKATLDLINASSPKTFETVNQAVDEAFSTGFLGNALTPVSSLIEALGGHTTTEGTVVKEVFDEFGRQVEKGAEKTSKLTGSSEAGEAFKQAVDVAMLAAGPLAAKAFKGKPKSEFKMDDVLAEVESELAPKETPVKPIEEPVKYEGGIDFVDPLKEKPTITQELKVEEPTISETNIPVAEVKPLGQTSLGKGQSGAINLGVFFKDKPLEETINKVSKEEWIDSFKKQYPEKADLAENVYTKLNQKIAEKPLPQGSSVNEVAEKADWAAGLISTRLGNIHPEIEQITKNSERQRMVGNATGRDIGDTFFTDINKSFDKENKKVIDNLLIDNNLTELKNRIPKDLQNELSKVEEHLNSVGDGLVSRDLIKGKRKNYFPIMVNDIKGLLETTGREDRSTLDALIKEADAKATLKGDVLSPFEKSDIITNYLNGKAYAKFGKPGFAKERQFNKIPDEYKEFYASPTESYHSYVRFASDKIAEHDFFKSQDSLVRTSTGNINIDASVRKLTGNLIAKYNLDPMKADELSGILSSRFSSGQQIANSGIQIYKDINNLTLLTDVPTTASQLADVFPSLVINGIAPTLQSLVNVVTKNKKVNVKEVAGILDNFAEEFVGERPTTRAVNKAFKKTGFSWLGRQAQEVIIGAANIARRNEAMATKPNSRLYREYQTAFGDKFPQLVRDLKSGTNTLLTDELLFSELSRIQPISKLEKSQAVLEHPNIGGAVANLKSYLLKQADVYRREVYNNIKRGNIKTAITGAAGLSLAYGLPNMYLDDLKAWWGNKPIPEHTAVDIGLSALKMFGLNDYLSRDLKEKGLVSAMANFVTPPFRHLDMLSQEGMRAGNLVLDKTLGKDYINPRETPTGESLTVLPFGDYVYGRYTEKGKARQERLDSEQLDKQYEPPKSLRFK